MVEIPHARLNINPNQLPPGHGQLPTPQNTQNNGGNANHGNVVNQGHNANHANAVNLGNNAIPDNANVDNNGGEAGDRDENGEGDGGRGGVGAEERGEANAAGGAGLAGNQNGMANVDAHVDGGRHHQAQANINGGGIHHPAANPGRAPGNPLANQPARGHPLLLHPLVAQPEDIAQAAAPQADDEEEVPEVVDGYLADADTVGEFLFCVTACSSSL